MVGALKVMMWNKSFATVLLMSSICGFVCNAYAVETKAKNAILMDYETGQYLYTKDHKKMVPPASMSKLMTVYMIFDKLKDGSLSLDDTFTVSENAWRKGGAASGGSTMFLKIGQKVRVEDLIKGILIQSGNDACIVAAENISGTEEDFAAQMNIKAKRLGLNNSSFVNSTGLPDPEQKMSMEDLAILAKAIIDEFPEFYHLFSEKYFTYNGIRQGNRNPLLYSMSNADGMKTGHTEEAGFCLTATAKRGDRRLIEVMSGMKSNKERSEEAEKLMNWGFREFDNYDVLQKGQKVATVPVWFGTEPDVELLVSQDLVRTIARSDVVNTKLVAVYDKPVAAPVEAGQKLGVVRVEVPNMETIEVPLVAAKSVSELGFFGRIKENMKYLLFGAN